MASSSRCQCLKCTSTVSDRGNLEIRLEGVLFISKQSLKELSEWARSASDSVLGQEGTRSASPTLCSALILFSAEYSCRPRAKHSATDIVAIAGKRRGKRKRQRISVFILVMTTRGKGLNRTGLKRRAEGRGAATFNLYILTVENLHLLNTKC